MEGNGLVGRARRYETTESWSNTMPCAWWAKFDTSESIKHRLNVVNKPVEAHCSKKRPRNKSRSEKLHRPKRQIPPLTVWASCSRGIDIYVSCSHVFSHPHVLLFIHEFMFPSRESFPQRGEEESEIKIKKKKIKSAAAWLSIGAPGSCPSKFRGPRLYY